MQMDFMTTPNLDTFDRNISLQIRYMIRLAIPYLMVIFISTQTIKAQGKLNVDSVFAYICKMGIQHPEIVIKQAILETGWFRAPFLMTRNNLFGFRYKTYLHFASWKESVEYYKKWQDKRYKDPNEDYYKFLIRIKYATSDQYLTNLKKVKYSNTCSNE